MSDGIFIFVLVIGVIFLVTQRWFWLIASGLGVIASFFAMCASVIHFQILGAMGFLLLMGICCAIFTAAGDS
jgi:hypothetical protein